jgi:hypothetical protein
MYDMVIPMIYDTVVFNKQNSGGIRSRIIGYGHGDIEDYGELSMSAMPRRS